MTASPTNLTRLPKKASLSRPLHSLSRPPRLLHSLYESLPSTSSCKPTSSILTLASTPHYIFSGSQSSEISVWERESFTLKTTLRGHTGAVLDLSVANGGKWLVSCSGDSTLRIWHTHTLTPLFLIDPHGETSAGDLFTIIWSRTLRTVFVGCQCTSLQWFTFDDAHLQLGEEGGGGDETSDSSATSTAYAGYGGTVSVSASGTTTPTLTASSSSTRKVHKFFDSYPQYERKPADIYANNGSASGARTPRSNQGATLGLDTLGSMSSGSLSEKANTNDGARASPDSTLSQTQMQMQIQHPKAYLAIPPQNVIDSAHFGYIYCMAYLRESEQGGRVQVQLATGSGDECVKIWGFTSTSSSTTTTSTSSASSATLNPTQSPQFNLKPTLIHTYTFTHGAVLALIASRGGETVFAGCQDGYVKVLDIETRTVVRTIIAHDPRPSVGLKPPFSPSPSAFSSSPSPSSSFSSTPSSTVTPTPNAPPRISTSSSSSTTSSDILAMSRLGTDIFTCSADGWVKRWSASFDCVAEWKAHEGIGLSSVVMWGGEGEYCLVTGGNDGAIHLWDIKPPLVRSTRHSGAAGDAEEGQGQGEDGQSQCVDAYSCIGTGSINDTMLYALSKFVSIPSISSDPARREDCRQGAIWLKKCLGQLGAGVGLLPTGEGNNPIVLATFNGSSRPDGKRNKRVLFYGHYDVVSAPLDLSGSPPLHNHTHAHTHSRSLNPTSSPSPSTKPKTDWHTPPFTLTPLNGYLYARGATDNKGPVMAVACAAAGLLARREMVGVDLVLLVEGEEEWGSRGFEGGVRGWRGLGRGVGGVKGARGVGVGGADDEAEGEEGKVDVVLVSNSTWIGDDRPCITYGLRGVIRCAIQIVGPHPDLHSGIEGGAVAEPMMDMVKLLGTLTDNERKVLIPGFYDTVRPQTDKEKELYTLLSDISKQPASSLSSRWREPSLTIHNVEISGPKNPTVIPASVKAQISIRIVPDQDLETIVETLRKHLEDSFKTLGSPNSLRFQVDHKADWWLGDLEDRWFKKLESAVKEEWGVEPLRIREGGSIPSVPYLEKEFGCRALHLPMGQSSDQAHLPNERISLVSLQKGKSVVERFLIKVAQDGDE